MSENIDEFDKIMSEFMKKKCAKKADPDLLERKNVIDDISKIIDDRLLSKQPLSLALTGIWGVGKSYILKEIEDKYSDRCIVFHYDCWKNDYYDEPLVGILSAISERLNKIETENPDEQQKLYYRTMREVVFQISRGTIQNYTGMDIGRFRSLFADIKNLLKLKKKIEIASFDSLSNVSDVIDVVNNLLCAYMAYEGKKILFVVDELDRCLPDYAIKILNRLHHICYETPIIQLVAVNDQELTKNINGLYNREKEDLFARRYFNRIFTNYYKIPVGISSSELIRLCWKDFDDFFVPNPKYDAFEMLSEVVLQDFSIRERKRMITLLDIYHRSALGLSKEKYPIEVACAELLELYRKFLYIKNDWTLTNGKDPRYVLYESFGDSEHSPYTLAIFNEQQTGLLESPKMISNFFLKGYELKCKIMRTYESDEPLISVFDRTIALLVNDGTSSGGSSEIGGIINVLKGNESFRKNAKFLKVFKDKISTYEE